MKVRLRDIPPDGLKLVREIDPRFFQEAVGAELAEGTVTSGTVRADVTRNGARVFVHGTVRGRFFVPCGRCLEPAALTVDASISTTFVPPLAPLPEAEHEMVEEDPDTQSYTGEEIDLGPVVRDEILLAVPIAPLCRPDCKGLCPRCGANLNDKPCGCPAEAPLGFAPRLQH